MKNSLAKNAFFNSVYMVLNVVFPIISYSYLARILGTDGVGISSAVQTNVSYFVILATLGIPAYGIREIAKTHGVKILRDRVFTELIVINGLLTAISILLFLFCTIHINQFNIHQELYYIYGITIILNFFNVDWFYQGIEQYKYIAMRNFFVKIVAFIAMFLFVKNKRDLNTFAFINVAAVSGNYFFNILNLRQKVNINFSSLNLLKHFKPLLYLALCTISTELYYRMDISMLDVMKSSDTVGIYTYSHRAINMIVALLTSATAVLFPRLNWVYEKDRTHFLNLVKGGFQLLLFVTFPCFLGIIVVSDDFITIWLGKEFIFASECLKILSIMIPIKCIGSLICYQVLMCVGKELILMKSYFLTMILNFGVNYFLIPLYGAKGAAVASVFAETSAFLFVFFFSRKIIGNIFDLIHISKVLFSSVGMFASILLLNDMVDNIWFRFLVAIISGITVYFVLNFILKNQSLYFLINNFKGCINSLLKK